ncbi:MAG: hypothetical protein N4Q32_05240, partial [Neisseriaceae bacterium]|nr:hypothetical protein [Neisseriaceae bacterium]
VIIHDGLKRMYVNHEDVYYYITVMNENYSHPALPDKTGIEQEILRGIYCLIDNKAVDDNSVQLLGSGTIL